MRFRCVSFIVGLALLTGSFSAAFARPASAEPTNAAKAAQLLRTVVGDKANDGLQSVIVGAYSGKDEILSAAIGDSMTGVPATSGMHFRAGIMQTEALATILLQLADRRVVSLDAPISRWLPQLPHAKEVTLRMLANSRSGYGDYLNDTRVSKSFEDNPFQHFTADQLIQYGTAQPMAFKPGTGFHYAHTNLVILGAALQKITGESVAQLVRERITAPLDLHDTEVPSTPEIQQPVQHAFSRDRGVYEESTYFDPSWASYSGVITSDVHDLAVFQRAIGKGTLLSKAGFAAQLATSNVGSGPMTRKLYYGLGVIVANTWILQHARVSGYDVVMAYLPATDLTIVVSSALGPTSTAKAGYSAAIFKDMARYLAPNWSIPRLFT